MDEQQQTEGQGHAMHALQSDQKPDERAGMGTFGSFEAKPETPSVSDRSATMSSMYPGVGEKPQTHATFQDMTPAQPAAPALTMPVDDRPVPVVKVLSVRGVEYAMMSILLWFGAGSLIFILIALIQGGNSFETLAFPLALLLVTTPGFAYLYLRLRRAELADPSLRLEASKRRYSQITQIVAFLTCFFNIVTVVYMLLSIAGGTEGVSIGKTLGSAVAVLAVAGGILAYYWVDEHRITRR